MKEDNLNKCNELYDKMKEDNLNSNLNKCKELYDIVNTNIYDFVFGNKNKGNSYLQGIKASRTNVNIIRKITKDAVIKFIDVNKSVFPDRWKNQYDIKVYKETSWTTYDSRWDCIRAYIAINIFKLNTHIEEKDYKWFHKLFPYKLEKEYETIYDYDENNQVVFEYNSFTNKIYYSLKYPQKNTIKVDITLPPMQKQLEQIYLDFIIK
jgi:hypothetical protein